MIVPISGDSGVPRDGTGNNATVDRCHGVFTQVPVKGWHDRIGEPARADAICDRLIHTAYVIKPQGPR